MLSGDSGQGFQDSRSLSDAGGTPHEPLHFVPEHYTEHTTPETGRLTERGPNSLGRRHLFLKTKRLEVIGRSGAGAGVRFKGP